jgi:aspartyl-tRNA(Asn)/glutamyl-tRNA(Gln) amidotransferase subunit B
MIERIRATLPELPDQRKQRFIADFGVPAYNAAVLVAEKEIGEYFEEFASLTSQMTGEPLIETGTKCSNWLISELFGVLAKKKKTIEDMSIRPADLAALLNLIHDHTISGRIAKEVLEIMVDTGDDPAAIIEAKGLRQITDTSAIQSAVAKVVADNPRQVEQFRAGNEKVLGWLVGQVMKATQGKANPGQVNQLLRQKLLA